MMLDPRPTTFKAILRQLCPRCREGRIFQTSVLSGFPRMHPRCPICGLKFEREEGYFLGAMYISYAIALIMITLLALMLWLGFHWGLQKTVVWAIILFVPLAFPLTLLARVLWIYLDQTFDPEAPATNQE